MNEAGLPSRRGGSGVAHRSDSGPPFQIGRWRSLPGFPTTKKLPTPLGLRMSPTFRQASMRPTSEVYSALSPLAILTELVFCSSFEKISPV